MAKSKTKKKEEIKSEGKEAEKVAKDSAKKIVVEEVVEPSSELPAPSKTADVGGEKVLDSNVEAEASTENDVSNENDEKKPESVNKNDKGQQYGQKKEGYSFKVLFVMFLVGAVCSGLVLGGVLYFRSNTDSEPTPKPSLTPVTEDEETPAPIVVEDELDLTEYKVQVLNGSGVAGIAGKTASTLEDEGFVDVVAGNASTQDYKGVEVSMTAVVETGIYDVITDALSEYEVIEGDELDEESSYDVVVIVGSD